LVETEKTCISRLRDLLMKAEKHMAEHDLRLVDRTSQVVEMKTLEALAQPVLVARVALCGKLLAAKQQIGEQVSKSEAELLGLTEPTRDSRAEAETIVKYLVENGLSGYMMKVLDMVRGVHSPMSVCGWLVTDDDTGAAAASSAVPTTTGVLVDGVAATTGETPTVVEATTVAGATAQSEEKDDATLSSPQPASPASVTVDKTQIAGDMLAKISEVVSFKLGDGSEDVLFESTGDHRIEVAATHVEAFQTFIGWCKQQVASATLGPMSDEQAAKAGVLRNTLVVLRKSLGEASTALEYQQVRAKKVEENIASYQEQAAEHVRISTVTQA